MLASVADCLINCPDLVVTTCSCPANQLSNSTKQLVVATTEPHVQHITDLHRSHDCSCNFCACRASISSRHVASSLFTLMFARLSA